MVDANGSLNTQYSYDPFGSTTASGVLSSNPSQYIGRENGGNALYYLRARYYSPVLHPFINQDPLGFAGSGTNFYAYAMNNPISFSDPFGLDPRGDADAALASLKGDLAPLDHIYALQAAHNLAGRKDKFCWWCSFGKSFVHDFSLTAGARNSGETWSQCVDRAQQSLLGSKGTYVLDTASGASLGAWGYTTPFSGPTPGPVPGTTMGPMSGWELDNFYNAAVDGAGSFARASKLAPVVSKGSGITAAVAIGVKSGFYVACAH